MHLIFVQLLTQTLKQTLLDHEWKKKGPCKCLNGLGIRRPYFPNCSLWLLWVLILIWHLLLSSHFCRLPLSPPLSPLSIRQYLLKHQSISHHQRTCSSYQLIYTTNSSSTSSLNTIPTPTHVTRQPFGPIVKRPSSHKFISWRI